MEDKQYEYLLDMKTDDGYYRIGDTIYDRDGEVVDSAEETAEAVAELIKVEQVKNQ